MAKLRLKILTPNRIIFDDDVDMVVLTSTDGEIGILPGHRPYSILLGYGITKIYNNDNIFPYAVFGGFASVDTNTVSILADIAESSSEIDSERAKMALERAERRSKEKSSTIDEIRMKTSMRKALVRLELTGQPLSNQKK